MSEKEEHIILARIRVGNAFATAQIKAYAKNKEGETSGKIGVINDMSDLRIHTHTRKIMRKSFKRSLQSHKKIVLRIQVFFRSIIDRDNGKD